MDSGFQVLDSGFSVIGTLDSGFQSLVGFWIPCYTGKNFPGFRNPDYHTWGDKNVLPTNSSPKLILTLASHLEQNLRGGVAGQFPRMIY